MMIVQIALLWSAKALGSVAVRRQQHGSQPFDTKSARYHDPAKDSAHICFPKDSRCSTCLKLLGNQILKGRSSATPIFQASGPFRHKMALAEMLFKHRKCYAFKSQLRFKSWNTLFLIMYCGSSQKRRFKGSYAAGE